MAVLHSETIELERKGSRLTGLLVRPDTMDPLPGVVQIQEWWGIEPHVVDLAHQLAAEGFVVLVPDLFHGKVVTEPDEAQKAVMQLYHNLENALREIQVAIDTLKARPDVDPKRVGVMGFCVGGMLTWHAALRSPDVAAAVPWYAGGFDPTEEQIAGLQTPVLAIYGGKDPSIPMEQIRKIESLLQAAGKDADVRVYPEAGHAFLNPAHGMRHEESAQDAWPRAVAFLKKHVAARA
ncbi:MAG TPA: dienelactone hydrolase family protein [Chloroflexia bacterium]|nr:dienelactone hydrolase family protein [Chloroflexia bacterium]